jgi:hypothetical protein
MYLNELVGSDGIASVWTLQIERTINIGERSITKKNIEGLGIIPKKVQYIDSILMH